MQNRLQQIFACKRISVAMLGWPKYVRTACKTACNRFSPGSEYPLQGSCRAGGQGPGRAGGWAWICLWDGYIHIYVFKTKYHAYTYMYRDGADGARIAGGGANDKQALCNKNNRMRRHTAQSRQSETNPQRNPTPRGQPSSLSHGQCPAPSGLPKCRKDRHSVR